MASPVDTSVKHFYSAMAGAPTVSGTVGSLISALDACLVTGFGAKVVDSGTISNGICRLNFASGASAAKQEAVISVSGASLAGLNGEQKVTAVSTSWLEFRTDLPDGAVTGSVSFKMASLGWEKVFSKTNVAVYRAVDPAGTRPYLRVDDSFAAFARVQMYESMTDVDTGTGITPDVAGGYYWHKWSSASATANFWLLIGDSRGFYFGNTTGGGSATTQNRYPVSQRYFGDLNYFRSGDAWGATLVGNPGGTSNNSAGDVFYETGTTGISLMRASTGIGAAVQASRRVFGSATSASGSDPTLGDFPSRSDNGLRLSEILVTDGAVTNGPRGVLPGVYHCPQSNVGVAMSGDATLTAGAGPFAGRKLLALVAGQPGSQSNGLGFLDVTGPWREG